MPFQSMELDVAGTKRISRMGAAADPVSSDLGSKRPGRVFENCGFPACILSSGTLDVHKSLSLEMECFSAARDPDPVCISFSAAGQCDGMPQRGDHFFLFDQWAESGIHAASACFILLFHHDIPDPSGKCSASDG